MIDLSGRIALVTGGSRGIGRAIALRLAEAGADVVINFISSQRAANEVAEEIAQLGRQAMTIKADMSEAEDIACMFEQLHSQFGRLDILVSNAASGGFRHLLNASPANFEAAMNTNVRSLMLATQAALPLMTGGGIRRKIIALSSHGSHRALPAYGLIGASKAALESMVRHLALELGNQGININTILAGLVATDSTKNFPEAEQAFREVAKRRLVGGMELSTRSVADVAVFLASPLSDLIQGQTIVVDGGEALHG